MTVKQVADRVVELSRQGKGTQAVHELYADDVVSVEAYGMPDMPAEQRGKQAILAKHAWWEATFEWHGGEVSEPLIADNHFAVRFSMDVTEKPTGRRSQMAEIAVYEVRDGKIAREQFFYATGG